VVLSGFLVDGHTLTTGVIAGAGDIGDNCFGPYRTPKPIQQGPMKRQAHYAPAFFIDPGYFIQNVNVPLQ
jgi:hypothetical protein